MATITKFLMREIENSTVVLDVRELATTPDGKVWVGTTNGNALIGIADSSFVDALTASALSLVNEVNATVASAENAVTALQSTIGSTVSSANSTVAGLVSSTNGAISANAQNMLDQVTAAKSAALTSVTNFVNTETPLLATAISNANTTVANLVTSTNTTVNSAVSSANTSVANAIGSYNSTITSSLAGQAAIFAILHDSEKLSLDNLYTSEKLALDNLLSSETTSLTNLYNTQSTALNSAVVIANTAVSNANTATSNANTATTNANTAATNATNAINSLTGAATSASNANISAGLASGFATNASNSATAASNSATNSASSATASGLSATAAANSALVAAAAGTTAGTIAGTAAAASSVSSAANSASAAATSASQALATAGTILGQSALAVDAAGKVLANAVNPIATALRCAVQSGVIDYSTNYINLYNYNTKKGEIGYYLPITGYVNRINFGDTNAIVNGYCIFTPSPSIILSAPPTSGSRDDLVFLECFFVNKNIGDTLYNYGGRDSGTAGTASVAQIALEWRLRVVSGVNFTTYAEGVDDATNVKANTPTNVATAYTYVKQTTDTGLYLTGTGSSGDKTALSTYDGYCYAIPLFRIKRRNNAGFTSVNVNGARDYYTITTCTYPATNPNSTATATFSASDYAKLQVGDKIYYSYNYNVKVLALLGSNQATVLNTGASVSGGLGTSYNLSDRPDALYSNIIDTRDIIDLRHKVSLTGNQYESIRQIAMAKITANTLVTKDKTVLQKDAIGINNLIPPFTSPLWLINTGYTINSDWSVTSTSTGAISNITGLLVKPSTTYSFSFASSGTVIIVVQDINGVEVSRPFNYSSSLNGTFTTPSTAYKLNFNICNNGLSNATYSNPTLVQGLTAVFPDGRVYPTTERLTKSNALASDTRTVVVNPFTYSTLKPDITKNYFYGYYNDSAAVVSNPGTACVSSDTAKVITKDSVLYSITSPTTGNRCSNLFSFDLTTLGCSATGLASALSKLKFGWDGQASGDNASVLDRTVDISIWNGSAWALAVDVVTDAVNMTPVELSLTTGFSPYVDSNGKVWFLVKSKYPASATNASSVSTDTAGLYVEMSSWSAGRTVKLTSSEGIISGVIDSDTGICTVTAGVNGNNYITVSDVSKLAVNDTVNFTMPNSTTPAGWSDKTITAIDTVNKIVTLNSIGSFAAIVNGYLVETTSATSLPTVTATGIAGTWSNLATATATYTLTTPPTTVTAPISISYSISYPANQGLSQMPTSVRDVTNSECAVEVKGRTLVNLLGKDGNFEVLPSGWSTDQATATLDSTNYKYGTNGIKVAITGSSYGEYYKMFAVDTTKYYIYLADIKNGNATNAVAYMGSNVTDTTKFNTSYRKVTGVSSIECGLKVFGTVGQYAYFDGARLYQLTDGDFGLTALQQYNLIDVDANWSGQNLANKFPYVDSVQFKSSTMLTAKNKNIIDLYTELSVISPNDVSIVQDGGYTSIKVVNPNNFYHNILSINFAPNKSYTIQWRAKHIGGVGVLFRVNYTDGSNDVISPGDSSGNYVQGTASTNASKSVQNIMTTYSIGTAVSYIDLNAFQIELGSTATAFVPQVKSQAHVAMPLASGESVYITPTQAVYKQTWTKNVQLLGSLGWQFSWDGTGWKSFSLSFFAGMGAWANTIATKYNGSIIPNSAITLADQQGVTGSAFQISVADTNSGWPEVYTPSTAECQAYFFGYQMTNPTGTSAWDGVSAKNWIRITTLDNRTAVCPTATYAGYTPYSLSYQLATPVYWIQNFNNLPILSAGSQLLLSEGVCQVEQLTGVQWMEKTVPYLHGTSVDLNGSVAGTGYPANQQLSYRLKNWIELDANGIKTNYPWSHVSALAYGLDRMYMNTALMFANYDPTSVYQCTYEMLDKYSATIDTLDIYNPVTKFAYSYYDAGTSEQSCGYYSFLPQFTFVNASSQIQAPNGSLTGFTAFYDYNPDQSYTINSTVLQLSNDGLSSIAKNSNGELVMQTNSKEYRIDGRILER